MTTPDPPITKLEPKYGGITQLQEKLDDTNWIVWREQIHHVLELCDVLPYIDGSLPCPDPVLASIDTQRAWHHNDVYAQLLITNNITTEQMVHINQLNMTVH